MKKCLSIILTILLTFLATQSAIAQFVPSHSNAIKTFGDYTNSNPCPTSGTITGTYKTSGPWVQTGPITCIAARLYFGSTVTINNTFTGTAGVEGNLAGIGSTGNFTGTSGGQSGAAGNGPGGGGPGMYDAGSIRSYPGGGGHGGAGGFATSAQYGYAGPTYPLDLYLPGSGAGYFPLQVSGNGGAGIYIESIGAITLTSTAAVHADGGASSYGGGSGGGVDFRSLGNITLNTGSVISANGGNGLNGGGGGGGIVSLMPGPGMSAVNNGSITVTGGTGANAGAAGTATVGATFIGGRTSF